ncbi:unnamed protein product [Scytosiphon promiscuus]
MTAEAATGSSAAGGSGGRGRGGGSTRPFRRKQRGWIFQIDGVASEDRSEITEARLLASVHERYTTVKRLVLRPAAGAAATPSPQRAATASASRLDPAEPSGPDPHPGTRSPAPPTGPRVSSSAVLVEIQFAGPQPSEGCGALLCHLLRGASVKAWPLELPRGRKKKAARLDGTGAVTPPSASSSDVENGGSARSLGAGAPSVLPAIPSSRLLLHHHRHRIQQPRELSPVPHQPREEKHHQEQQDDRLLWGSGGADVMDPAGKSSGCSSGGGGVAPLMVPMADVRVELSRRECDLEGHPFPAATTSSGLDTAITATDNPRQCHLVFTGLEKTGQDLSSLRVTALFGVDCEHQIATMASAIQIGIDGRAYSPVFYPSMQEIWPDLFATPAVRVVEVDVAVEILSDSGGEFRYVGPQLKVIYLRTKPPPNTMEPPPRPSGRQTACRLPVPVTCPPLPTELGQEPRECVAEYPLPGGPVAVAEQRLLLQHHHQHHQQQ